MEKQHTDIGFAKRAVSFILDIIFIGIATAFVLTSIANVFIARTNKVPFVFGLTTAEVLSGSMVASGFKVGDNVIIKKISPKKLQIGDAVSYYYYSDINNPSPDVGHKIPGTNPSDSATEIWFHHINDITIDNSGIRWFQMKGSSNPEPDSYLIREDCIVGVYANVPKFLTKLLSFLKTPQGMLSCIVAPAMLLLIFLLYLFSQHITVISLENKIFSQKIELDHPKCIKHKAGNGLPSKKKAIVLTYASADKHELFEEILYGKNKKQKKQL